MSINLAIAELQKLFPTQSVNIRAELWSHMYQGKRTALQPAWAVYVCSEGTSPQLSFPSKPDPDKPATLETVMLEIRQHLARQKRRPESLDGLRSSLKTL